MPEIADLKREFTPVLRRSEARRLVERLGITSSAFRIMVESGVIEARRLAGKRSHFLRDQIIGAIFNQPKP